MKVLCEKCGASHELDEGRIPVGGMMMKCPACLHSFPVRRPGESAGKDAAPARPSAASIQVPGQRERGTVMGIGPTLPPPEPDAPAWPEPATASMMSSGPPAAAAPSAPPAPKGPVRYHVRRRTGRTFGPFLETAIISMLEQGKLDGDEDLSTDAATWVPLAQVPALAHLAQRAAPAAAAAAPPPAEAAVEDVDLPVPKRAPDEAVDLPAPKGFFDSLRTNAGGPSPRVPPPIAIPPSVRPEPRTGPAADPPRPAAGAPRATGPVITPPPPAPAPDPFDLDGVDLLAPKHPSGRGLPVAGAAPPATTVTPVEDEIDLPAPKALEPGRGAARAPTGGMKPVAPLAAAPARPRGSPAAGPPARPRVPTPPPAAAAAPPARPRVPTPPPSPGAASDGLLDLPAPKASGDVSLQGLMDLPAPKGPSATTAAPRPTPARPLVPPPVAPPPVAPPPLFPPAAAPSAFEPPPAPAPLGLDLPLAAEPPRAAASRTAAPPALDLDEPSPEPGPLPTAPPASAGTFDLDLDAGGRPAPTAPPASASAAALDTGAFELDDAPGGPGSAAMAPARGPGGAFLPPDGGVVEEIPGVLDLATEPPKKTAAAEEKAFDLDEAPPPAEGLAAVEEPVAAPAGAKAPAKGQPGASSPGRSRMALIGGAVALVLLGGVGFGLYGKQLLGGGRSSGGPGDADEAAVRALLEEDTWPALTKAAARLAGGAAPGPRVTGLAAQAQLLAVIAHQGPRDLVAKARGALAALPPKTTAPPDHDKARALLAIAEGKPAEAEPILKALATAQPRDAAIPLYRGWMHLAANRPTEAAASFQQSAELQPSAAALFGAGLATEAAGNLEGARAFFSRALTKRPTHAASALAIARLTQEPGAREAALRKVIAERATACSPGEKATALAGVGVVQLESGRLEEAEKSFEQALAADRASAKAQNGLAAVLYDSGRYDGALQRYQDIRRGAPKDLDAILGVARCLLELGRLLDADEPIAAAEKLAPTDARVQLLRGQRQELTETPAALEGAVKSYLGAIKADPKLAPAYAALARAYLKLKKDSDAIATLKQAQATLPASAVIDNAFGEAYLRLGDLGQAEERLRAALAKNPLYHVARFNLGAVLEKQNRLDGAEKEYRELADKAPRFAGLAERRARLYQRMGQVEQALAAFDQALQGERPAAALRLAAAELFIEEGKRDPCIAAAPAAAKDAPAPGTPAPAPGKEPAPAPAPATAPPAPPAPGKAPAAAGAPPAAGAPAATEAVSCFELARRAADSVLLEDPRSAAANDLVGRALAGAGRPEEGLQFARRAAGLDPQKPEYHLHVGEILEQLGRIDLALQELDLAVAGDPTLVGPYVARGRIYLRQRQFREALVELGKAAQRDRGRADIPRLQGDAYAGLRQLGPAIDAYLLAARRAPHDAEGQYKLGEACADAERRGPAVEAFKRALTLGGDKAPFAADVHRRLGFIHKESGARGPAVAEFKRYLELKPDAADKGEILQQIRFLE
jgi:tetratricopeptide (TPR) repeat protein